MIYDCFPFLNEFEILEIRLNELWNVVDKFYLMESTKSFTNKDKPLHFENNKSKFEKYLSKIVHIIIDDTPPNETNAWNIERYQRDRGVPSSCNIDDIIMISDVDEIPKKELFTKFNIERMRSFLFHGFYQVQQIPHYYYFNCIGDHDWYGTVIANYGGLLNNSAQTFRDIREAPFGMKIMNGGWHFSYFTSPENIKLKIESFAHQEFNNDQYNTIEKIEKAMKEGVFLFDHNRRFTFEDFDKHDLPMYLKENREKFKHLIRS